MELIIDASNLRQGGGVTHITEVLNNIPEENVLFSKVYIYSNNTTLSRIDNKEWLIKKTHPFLQKSTPFILLWKIFYLRKILDKAKESLLLDPAGTYNGSFRNYVSMSRNMLIFDSRESDRYGFSWMRIKFFLLRKFQIRAFKKAKEIIFISNYARTVINGFIKRDISNSPLIYHGVNNKFSNKIKNQHTLDYYNFDRPFRFLYISLITVYKHQCKLIQAIKELRDSGFPIVIDLVGGAYAPELKRFEKIKNDIDPKDNFVFYHGKKNYDSIHNFYKKNDGVIFASTCENMPNILIESMRSGLPILSSSYASMPEFLGVDYKFYFDPTDISSIKENILAFLGAPNLRRDSIENNISIADTLTWKKCAIDTFSTLYKVALEK